MAAVVAGTLPVLPVAVVAVVVVEKETVPLPVALPLSSSVLVVDVVVIEAGGVMVPEPLPLSSVSDVALDVAVALVAVVADVNTVDPLPL